MHDASSGADRRNVLTTDRVTSTGSGAQGPETLGTRARRFLGGPGAGQAKEKESMFAMPKAYGAVAGFWVVRKTVRTPVTGLVRGAVWVV